MFGRIFAHPVCRVRTRTMKSVKLVIVASSWLAAASAVAQPVTPPPRSTQSILPNVFDTSVGVTLEGRADYTNFGDDSDFLGDVTVVGINLHVQYIAPEGFGGYGMLPIAYFSGNDDSETYVGNIELGGLYVFRQQSNLDLYLRGGFALNTASDEGILFGPIAHTVPRLTDYFTTGFDTNWFRGGGGIRSTNGSLVIGGAAMLDVALDAEGDNDFGLLSLAGSVGVQQPMFGLAAGLAFIQLVGDDADDDDNLLGLNIVGDVAVGPQVRLFVAGGFNFEDDFDGFSIGLGARANL